MLFRNAKGANSQAPQTDGDCTYGKSVLTAPNPGFRTATDYHLTAATPAGTIRDALDCGNSEDIDGDARPKGGKCDLGADEYGQALDERAQGSTSESEASNARAHAAMRTAVTTIVSTLTAGVADKAVRGAAATVSTGRALAGGAAAGSLGAGTTVATSDAYNNYIAGTQHGASSMQDYVTAMLLGGGIGAGFGALANRSSRKSVAGAAEEARAVESPIAGPFREPSPPLAVAAEKAGFDLRALQAPQRDLLDLGEASLASGDHYAAVKHFDQLVASGVPKHSVDALETELARALGKTAPSVYREPRAILPMAKRFRLPCTAVNSFTEHSRFHPKLLLRRAYRGAAGTHGYTIT